MLNKRTIIAVLAGTVTGFLLGWLIFGILLAGYYKDNSINYPGLMKEPPLIWCFALSNLAWALMFGYVFKNWANVSSFVRGATAAVILTAPVVVSFDLYMYGSMNLMNGNALVVDVIANIIMSAFVGGVIGALLGMGKPESD